MKDMNSLVEAYNRACDELNAAIDAFEALPDDVEETEAQTARDLVTEKTTAAEAAKQAKEDYEASQRAREKFQKIELSADDPALPVPVKVDEPDMYTQHGRTFIRDLFAAKIKGDFGAQERLGKHQQFEIERYAQKAGVSVEQYAVATSTLGGVIPPQYLVGLYAKASRNGRVFLDQCNGSEPLPPEGMSLIVPRLTQGLSAAAQATESTAVSTQDPTETDLTVDVRTYAGYSPVSRQTLERAAYSEAILYEDLIARYWAALDSDAIDGSGNSGTHLGLIATSGIQTSTTSTATVAAVWPKIADVIQKINTNTGGLGYVADKIVMHPRRWGWFEAATDTAGRPLFGIDGQPGFNVTGEGSPSGYGYVGRMHGLPVFTDANIPTTFGTGTNEDRIIVMASPVVHVWERNDDPVTLSFEQQAGTSLQVQIVCFGYSAFTAGRYPASCGYVGGAGLATPSF